MGLTGPTGPAGLDGMSPGWTKKFNSAAITGVVTDVLSEHVTGASNYLVNAKVNSPFANGAKQVQCNLIAVENNTQTVLDTSETLLLGNATTTAKGVIALGSQYTPVGGSSAEVDIILQCSTGGDSRTLTKGSMNIFGAKDQ